jgi:hypothetical protein
MLMDLVFQNMPRFNLVKIHKTKEQNVYRLKMV